jgi:hypothetical protein
LIDYPVDNAGAAVLTVNTALIAINIRVWADSWFILRRDVVICASLKIDIDKRVWADINLELSIKGLKLELIHSFLVDLVHICCGLL